MQMPCYETDLFFDNFAQLFDSHYILPCGTNQSTN